MNTDLEDALIAWQGGELPPGRADALLDKLRTDVEFRKALAEEVWTLSLTRVAQSPDPRWLALHEEIGLVERRFEAIEGGFEKSLMSTVKREPLRFVNAWWRSAATAAAAAVVVLTATLLFQRGGTVSLETLAVLVPESNEQPSRAIGAGPLRLAQGQARLLFTNGVIVDVEGPASMRLLSVSRVVCSEGKLRTHVPDGAEGFCVETPRGAVTDLGTVLGISVTRAGKTDVNVFEGQAELSTRIPGQEGLRTAVLNQNEKAGFHSTTGEIRSSDETAFLDAVQPQTPPLKLPADYSQRILAAKPVHYWRLNRIVEGKVPNEITEGPALLVAGGASIEVDTHGVTSAHFHGRENPGVLHLEKPWRTPADGYAVEFWFMPDTLELMALAALTTTDAMRPHVGLVEIGGRRPGEANGTGSLRYLLRWPAGHRDGLSLFSSTAAALPYQWHHVVAQQRSGRMELFLNGKLIGPAQTDSPPQSIDSILQLGCLEHRPGQDLAKLRRPFSGRMAEVAVYERVLSAQEITAHAAVR